MFDFTDVVVLASVRLDMSHSSSDISVQGSEIALYNESKLCYHFVILLLLL